MPETWRVEKRTTRVRGRKQVRYVVTNGRQGKHYTVKCQADAVKNALLDGGTQGGWAEKEAEKIRGSLR